MTDLQLITLVVALIVPLLFNNSRITDTKETLRAEMGKGFVELRLEMNERFNSIDRKLDELLRLVADHDTRITALENRPR